MLNPTITSFSAPVEMEGVADLVDLMNQPTSDS